VDRFHAAALEEGGRDNGAPGLRPEYHEGYYGAYVFDPDGNNVEAGSLLPKKSPWLNSMEPKWVHGKRKVVEPDGLLTVHELAERVCLVFDCPHYEHLSIAENAA
jgi:hypothetical protein